MKKHQNHRYFTAVCIASAIFAVLLCLALFLIVTGDRSELDRMEAQAAVFLEQMEQAADSARQSALAGAQDNFGNSMPGTPDASSGIQPGPADSASGKSTDETYADSILAAWYKAGVHHVADIARLDSSYQKERASRPARSGSTAEYNSFMHSSYDFDALEEALLKQ